MTSLNLDVVGQMLSDYLRLLVVVHEALGRWEVGDEGMEQTIIIVRGLLGEAEKLLRGGVEVVEFPAKRFKKAEKSVSG